MLTFIKETLGGFDPPFKVSRHGRAQLAAHLGESAEETAVALNKVMQSGKMGDAWADGDFVNLRFEQAFLWRTLEASLAASPLPSGWEEADETPDFAPIPYALNRLRMELYALARMAREDGEAKRPGWEHPAVEALLWPLLSLDLWPEEQQGPLREAFAEMVSKQLDCQRFHSKELLPLWQRAARLLQEN